VARESLKEILELHTFTASVFLSIKLKVSNDGNDQLKQAFKLAQFMLGYVYLHGDGITVMSTKLKE
jgi:hypothetical protein